uniref:Retrotransposon gag domain-containing protein n=1 Tax=Nicotiana tabacum TaxID=4097 RepID=A0A1S3ZE62_TOBAC|nr:PREDICTED: uncharacterized protein LOC107785722 [Nicotiana tabacum]
MQHEPVLERPDECDLGTDPSVMKVLEELTKRIESGEKKITRGLISSRAHPPILKGVDSKKFVQRPFLSSAAPKPIPKKFRMPDILKYNGTTDSNEHSTSYTCVVKGNDLKDDEIESVLLKKFRETLSKGAMMWYHNLPPNLMDSFAMLADSFVKVHVGAIKVATKKSDIFKVKQRENEMLRKFAFIQGLNERSLIASKQLKQNLVEYPTATWADALNKESKSTEREWRSGKERYQPNFKDQRDILWRNIPRNDRGVDRRQKSRGLMSKIGFNGHSRSVEAPRLSEYNFNIDVSDIVLAMGRFRDTRWPKPTHSDPSRRNPNLMCEYHGIRGHSTDDCRQLREEVARLINEGHLREFLSNQAKNHCRERNAKGKNEPEEPQHVIHMIVGGADAPHGPVIK